MRVGSIVLCVLVSLTTGIVHAQSQPQIYPLNEDGSQGQQVDPRPTTVHHYPVYQQDVPPADHPWEKATRGPSRAIHVARQGHRLWQLILIPKDESVSSDASIIMLKVPGRDECEKRILALYQALGDEDDSDDPDYTFACQPAE